MAYGAFVPSVRVAGLERAARLAGEAFGYEDASVLPRWRRAGLQPMRLSILIGGFGLVAALLMFALR